jgi:hypothetical protein
VARSLRYSSNLRTEKSACNKLTFVVQGYFPIILKHIFCIIWSLWTLNLYLTIHIVDHNITITDDWPNACRIQLGFNDGCEIAVVSEEGVRNWNSSWCLTGYVVCMYIPEEFSIKRIIPRYFIFAEQVTELMDKVISGTYLYKRRVKSINTVLCKLIQILHCSRSDMWRSFCMANREVVISGQACGVISE